MLQSVLYSLLQSVAVCCSLLQSVAVCCSLLQSVALLRGGVPHTRRAMTIVQCGAVYCGAVVYVSVCCRELTCQNLKTGVLDDNGQKLEHTAGIF